MAHHVERHLSPADVAEIVEAARKTQSAHEIKAEWGDANYYLQGDEMFARAYAQFVAQASGDVEALNELKSTRDTGSASAKYWDRKDFEVVDTTIRMILKRKGWL